GARGEREGKSMRGARKGCAKGESERGERKGRAKGEKAMGAWWCAKTRGCRVSFDALRRTTRFTLGYRLVGVSIGKDGKKVLPPVDGRGSHEYTNGRHRPTSPHPW